MKGLLNLRPGGVGHWTPARRRQAAQDNDTRVRHARLAGTPIRLRLPPQVRVGRRGHDQPYVGLRGEALTADVPEAVDVWDLLADLKAFALAWRPMRERTPEAQVSCRRLLDEWQAWGRQPRR